MYIWSHFSRYIPMLQDSSNPIIPFSWPTIKVELWSSYITISKVVLVIYYSNLECCCSATREIYPNKLFQCFVLCRFHVILGHYFFVLSTPIHRKSPNTSIYYEVQSPHVSIPNHQQFTFNYCRLWTIDNKYIFNMLCRTPCPLRI